MSEALVRVDSKAFGEALRGLSKELKTLVGDTLRDAAYYGKTVADRANDYEDRTGKLRRSTKATFRRADMTASLVNAQPYALYVDEGTRPHEIAARNKPFLRFFWKREGRWVTTKRVFHPGTQSMPFFTRARGHASLWFRPTLSHRTDSLLLRFNQGK